MYPDAATAVVTPARRGYGRELFDFDGVLRIAAMAVRELEQVQSAHRVISAIKRIERSGLRGHPAISLENRLERLPADSMRQWRRSDRTRRSQR
jgi:hypothetical protein